jgi:hypothetical protein
LGSRQLDTILSSSPDQAPYWRHQHVLTRRKSTPSGGDTLGDDRGRPFDADEFLAAQQSS